MPQNTFEICSVGTSISQMFVLFHEWKQLKIIIFTLTHSDTLYGFPSRTSYRTIA